MRQSGFTLVEVLVAMAIMGILMAVAMPEVASFLQTNKMKAAASDVFSGVQLARAEAVRRNLPVQFGLTASPVALNAVAAPVYSASGTNWVVGFQDPAINAYRVITSRSAADGKSGITVTAPTASITYTALGATTLGATAVIDVKNPAAGTCLADGGTVRCLRIAITAGGQSRICDPSISAANVADSRVCP